MQITSLSKTGALALLAAALLTGCGKTDLSKPAELKTDKQKISYTLGVDMGRGMKKQNVDIDPEMIAKGIYDARYGTKVQLSDEEMQKVMMAFSQEMQKKMMDHYKKMAEENKAEGDKFLSENKSKPGVTATPSGLQYKVVKAGAATGKKPKVTDKVTINYAGRLLNGTEFDSSYKRGQPATMPLANLIPGWKEAIPLMKEGDKWEIYVPSDMAYGPRGAGGVIPPNATLVFEVELLKVN
ncbi:MAG: FKBP-type peptidyl-prolyl cis-trans isomerase [Verrucomicrobiae bacterium]|nr:FKBP-type peptidyl-prolyl cis-trans isomerase [Verrucomicrobiae bacterium]